MKKKLFVDMDGTLARWEDGTPFEIVCQPEYSVRLPQNGNVVTALRSLFEHHQDDFDIFVLSSVLDLPHAIPDKEKWLDMYCEYIDSYHRLFVPYGMSKGKFVKEKFGILTGEDYLLDDYSKNIIEWTQEGGHPIKVFNGVNGKSLAYVGDYTCAWLNAEQICKDILTAMGLIVNDQMETLLRNILGSSELPFFDHGYRSALMSIVSEMGFHNLVEEIGESSGLVKGKREFTEDDIHFVDEMDASDPNFVNFCLQITFNPVEVFGEFTPPYKGDTLDFINVYANYNVEKESAADYLEITCVWNSGEETDYRRKLSDTEKKIFTKKMKAYDSGSLEDLIHEYY